MLTIHEAGKAQQSTPDDIVLKTASADGRAILTLNRKHFVQPHAKQPSHAGIASAHLILISKGKRNEFMTRYNRLLNSPVN